MFTEATEKWEDEAAEDADMNEEEEEEEDEPAPVKSLAQESLGPKKEHVNVVFIGHVGKSCEWTSDGYCKSWRERLRQRQSDHTKFIFYFVHRCRKINYWRTYYVSTIVQL